MTAIAPEKMATESAEETLEAIVRKITPAILDIIAKKENGEISIRFQTGQFRQAVRKEVTL